MQRPKPDYRAERRRRRREIKKLDKDFQSDMPDRPTCVCGHSVDKEYAAKHHAKHRRKYMEYRYDNSNCAILCFRHHAEIHYITEACFYLRYGRNIRRNDPGFFAYLQQKYYDSVS